MMDGKKILIYAQGADRGGVATALGNLIGVLESAGHSVSVMVPYAANIAEAAIAKKYIVGYCRRRPIKINLFQRMVNLFSLLTAYRFFFMGVKRIPHDVCIVYFAPGNAQWVRYTNKPIIGWFHNMSCATREEACVSWQEKLRTCLMERFYGRFKALIAITDEVADSYAKRYNIKRPQVVQNLLSIDDILTRSNAPLKTPLKGDKKLVYCGRMSHDKGLDRLITALGKIKKSGMAGWHLTVVGDGQERALNEELAAKLDLAQNITFIGMVENPYPYMRAADLLICPSRAEGLGLVLWESLICQTAVLATDCGGTRTALRDSEWGRLVDNDDESLYQGIADWLNGSNYDPKCGFGAVNTMLREMNAHTQRDILGLLGD